MIYRIIIIIKNIDPRRLFKKKIYMVVISEILIPVWLSSCYNLCKKKIIILAVVIKLFLLAP